MKKILAALALLAGLAAVPYFVLPSGVPALAQIIQPGQSIITTGENTTLLGTQNSDNVDIRGGVLGGVQLGITGTLPQVQTQSLVVSNVSAGAITTGGLTATGPAALTAITSTSLASPGGAPPGLRPMGVLFTTAERHLTGAGTGAQDLVSWSLPANALNRIGSRVRIRGSFSTAANGNNKTIACSFGTNSITSAATAANNKQGWCQIDVVRTGVGTQIVTGMMQLDTTMVTPTFAAGTETDTAAITIKGTCTDGTNSAGDCTLNDFYVEVMN